MMNADRARVYALITAAAGDLNAMLPSESRIDPAEETLLTADGGQLTSLTLVGFLLAVEEKLTESFARPILLFDEKLIGDPNGPFRTIGTLADYITGLLQAA